MRGNRVPFGRDSHCSEGDLSAYLDAQLATGARKRCDAHLAACGGCRDALQGLSAVRASLRALPRATAPRSFRLRQAQVEAARPSRQPLLVQALPLLSGVSAVSLVAFVVLVGVSASGGIDPSSSESDSSAGSVTSRESEAPTSAEFAAAQDSAATKADDGAQAPNAPLPGVATNETPEDYLSSLDSTERSAYSGNELAPGSTAEPDDSSAPQVQPLPTGDDNDTAMYIAMAATAALALGSGGLALAGYRRTR